MASTSLPGRRGIAVRFDNNSVIPGAVRHAMTHRRPGIARDLTERDGRDKPGHDR
jgi:hypothetical protein